MPKSAGKTLKAFKHPPQRFYTFLKKEVIILDSQAISQIRKNVYGVREIDSSFQKQISELFFQQIKLQTLR